MKPTNGAALFAALAGTLLGVVAAGSLPPAAQPLPRIALLAGGISLVVWSLKTLGPAGARRPGRTSTGRVAGALAALCAALSATLFALDAPRVLTVGAPGLAAAVVLLGYAALTLRESSHSTSGPGR